MFACVVVVIVFVLDWLLFFALKTESSLTLVALLVLLLFCLYTLALLSMSFGRPTIA